jgi:hypothetical protein
MVLKVRYVFLSFLATAIIVSCANKKNDYVTKFVYFTSCGISHDTSYMPHLNIIQYLEYKQNSPIKIATANCSNYGYDLNYHFFNYIPNDSFNELLNKAFCEIAYGNSFKQRIEIFPPCYDMPNYYGLMYTNLFFYIETAELRKIKKTVFYLDTLSPEIQSVSNYINRVFKLKTLMKTNRFEFDNTIEKIQKELFLYNPPPPPPPEVLEGKVKFTTYKKKTGNTIVENKDSISLNWKKNLDSIK